MFYPAIVIPCYNRTKSLTRLLRSLDSVDYPADQEISLVFSIDFHSNPDVLRAAKEFKWSGGQKKIHVHKQRIGLKNNILFCGDLSSTYNAVIVLEDDSVVSPTFYRFAQAAMAAYIKNAEVAQISLYAYEYSEICKERFHPFQTGEAGYFLQWGSSRGQLWTADKWSNFRNWLSEHPDLDEDTDKLPPLLFKWPAHSWKKHYIHYLVNTGKTVFYPYAGVVTNFGSSGTNTHGGYNPDVQSPLTWVEPESLNFPSYSDNSIQYDCFFQPWQSTLDRFSDKLRDYTYTVDFQASKPLSSITTPFLLSTRVSDKPTYQFSWNLFPLESNVIQDVDGQDIHFAPTDSFRNRLPLYKQIRLIFWSKRISYGLSLLKHSIARLLLRLPGMIRYYFSKFNAR